MKNVVLLILIAAILPLCEPISGQDLDSLILPTVRGLPGDTVEMTLFLRNQSFSVGGFRSVITLPDIIQVRFEDARRGVDVEYFGYYIFSPFTQDTIGLTGIASMPPRPTVPLPPGYHEIAVINIIIDDFAEPGSIIPIMFINSGDYANAISDSSGNIVARPFTVDGAIIVEPNVGIDDDMLAPAGFELMSNYPNPFNAQTTIEFSISESGYASIVIFDLQGRKVRELFGDYVSAGNRSIIWNGRSDSGYPVASGVYLYRLTIGNNAITKKMNLIK